MSPTDPEADRLAMVIRLALVRQRRTHREVARTCGLDETGWHKRMGGHIDWRLPELRAVAAELHIPIAELIPDPNQEAPPVAQSV